MSFRAETIDEALVGVRRERQKITIKKPKQSPYFGVNVEDWSTTTRDLLREHPLKVSEVVDAVLLAWNGIFISRIGHQKLRIGLELCPVPQIMGFLLHELIPFEFQAMHPQKWATGIRSGEKDLVCVGNPRFSIEIKTSSSPQSIFGNRSYGQQNVSDEKKSKDGFYIAVNFQKWDIKTPCINLIRWGWLDHSDWSAQNASTGQQANLPAVVENNQLLTLFKR